MNQLYLLLLLLLPGCCLATSCHNTIECQHITCHNGHHLCYQNQCVCQTNFGVVLDGEHCSRPSDCVYTDCTNQQFTLACEDARCDCKYTSNGFGAVVDGEHCSQPSDCIYTHCSKHYTMACENSRCECKDVCHNNPCSHRGHCSLQTAAPYYHCACNHGWTGVNCSENACHSNPCGSHGHCSPQARSPYYHCKCDSGWFGQTCTENVCQSNPCYGNGACRLHRGEPYYICYCHAGYFGEHCRATKCDQNPCHHGGNCSMRQISPFYDCSCPNGYHGINCEVVDHVTKVPTTPSTSTPTTRVTTTAHTATSSTTSTAAATTRSSTSTKATTLLQTTTTTHLTHTPHAHTFNIPPDPRYGPYCLACDDVVAPSTCEYITRCGPHEICYVDSFVTSMGTIRYNVGCRDTQQCVNSKRSSSINTLSDASTIIVCSECCQGHMCNSGGCGVEGYTNKNYAQRGPICFHCEQEKSPSECSKIAVCGVDQICAVEQAHVATTQQQLWKSVCIPKSECISRLQNYAHSNLIHSYVTADHHYAGLTINGKCGLFCCNHDLCNNQCPGTEVGLIG